MIKRQNSCLQILPWNLFEPLDIRVEKDDGPEAVEMLTRSCQRSWNQTWGSPARSCPSSSPASSSPAQPALCNTRSSSRCLNHQRRTCRESRQRPMCARSHESRSLHLQAGSLFKEVKLWLGVSFGTKISSSLPWSSSSSSWSTNRWECRSTDGWTPQSSTRSSRREATQPIVCLSYYHYLLIS